MKMGVVQNKVWFLLDEEELLPYEVLWISFVKENHLRKI